MSSQPNPAVAAQPDAQQSPFHDPAEPILRAEPSIDDDSKANLWDTFHSKSTDELVQHLHSLAIPNETKTALWQAKQAMTPKPVSSNIEKVSAAIQKLSQLDPVTLDIAEKHPIVSKAFIDAAVKPPETPKQPVGEAKSAGKGAKAAKPAKGPQEAPTLVPDIPATPSGHSLVLASDWGVHHIPTARMDAARKIDPGLKVLHVEP
jgi:hypothetical protein